MTHDAARAFIGRMVDGVRRRDLPALMREYAPGCELQSPTAGGSAFGAEAVAGVYETWFTAFPDLTITTERVIVDDHDVVHVAVLSGTLHGGFMGLPATHKPFRIPLVAIYTIVNGLVTREQRITDFTGLLVQIGVLKARPA